MRVLCLCLLLTLTALAEDFVSYASFTGGSATVSVGVLNRADGRHGLIRFATAHGSTDLRFSPTQWAEISQAVRGGIEICAQLDDGEQGPETTVAGLQIRAVHQLRPAGIRLASEKESIVIHDLGGLKGAVDSVTAALRRQR